MFHVFVIVFLLLFSYYLFLREEVMFSPVFVCLSVIGIAQIFESLKMKVYRRVGQKPRTNPLNFG